MSHGLEQAIVTVECCNPVSLGHGRIVKGGIDKIHQGIVGDGLSHNRLANMDNFGGIGTETMNPQHFQRFPMKENLQHSGRLPGNLSPSDTLEVGMSHFVGDQRIGQLAFCLADRTDFGAGINPRRNIE